MDIKQYIIQERAKGTPDAAIYANVKRMQGAPAVPVSTPAPPQDQSKRMATSAIAGSTPIQPGRDPTSFALTVLARSWRWTPIPTISTAHRKSNL